MDARAHLPDLFIQGRFGNLAFLNIFHEIIVGANKADLQFFGRPVPLAPDHDPVPIVIWSRAGDDRCHYGTGDFSNAIKQVGDLLLFHQQLNRVTDVLVLATATAGEIAAFRGDPVG